MIYLDNSATTKVCAPAAEAAYQAMTEGYFNPSALYAPAMQSEQAMTRCREMILREVNAEEGARVVFTSGGTEGDNLALFGLTGTFREGDILYSAGEHPAVREAILSMRNLRPVEIPLGRDGLIDVEKLRGLLSPATRLVSVMQVNNETGAAMPLAEVAALIQTLCPDAYFHVDGVQGFMRVPVSLRTLHVDAYTLSGHKIHAPKGIGALVLSRRAKLAPRQIGGGQEKALRSGTENTPGIAGLCAAIACYPKDNQLRAVKCHLAQAVRARIPDMVINGPDPASPLSAPHILNLSLPPVRSETMLHALEGDQIYVGIGSACSSQKQKLSRVLTEMHVPRAVAECALRFSLCPDNTMEEMDIVADAIEKYYTTFKKFTRR